MKIKGIVNKGFIKVKGFFVTVWTYIKRFFVFLYSLHLIKKLKSSYSSRLAKEGIEDSEYRRASVNFWAVGVVSIILLIALALAVVVFGGNNISFDKMYYLYRDVNAMGRIGEGENTRLDYTLPKKNQDFTLFKNGLCVAGDDEIQIFNKNGNQTLSVSTTYSNPRALSSKEFVVVYDLGGRGFSAYNSFSDIYSETREYPISTAALSDEGILAIVGQTKAYSCELTVYDSEFAKQFSYSRNDYAVSCDFDATGRYIALVSLSSRNGDYLTSLTIIDTKKQEVKREEQIEGVLPYECRFMDGGRIALACSDRVLVFNDKLELYSEYEYPSLELWDMSLTDNGVALIFINDRLNLKNTLVVLDSKGKEKLEYEYTGNAYDTVMAYGCVYIAEYTGIFRIDYSTKNESFAELDSDIGRIIVCDKDRVIVARQSVADVIVSFG